MAYSANRAISFMKAEHLPAPGLRYDDRAGEVAERRVGGAFGVQFAAHHVCEPQVEWCEVGLAHVSENTGNSVSTCASSKHLRRFEPQQVRVPVVVAWLRLGKFPDAEQPPAPWWRSGGS